MKKLLLIGSGTVHTYNYYRLIEGFFDQIKLNTDRVKPGNEDIDVAEGNFEIRNPLKAQKNIRFIRRQITEFEPDIIHVQQANSTAWLTLKANQKNKIPVVVTAWGSDILVIPEKSLLLKKMTKYILTNADRLTADAEYVVSVMKKLFSGIKHEVLIANFGIESFYKETPKENIVYSNRLHQKLYRIDEIIRAFERFSVSIDEPWKLVIAGEDADTPYLKDLADKSGVRDQIEFIGWVDKEKNYEMYNRAKIFVSIPISDATSISLLEAMHSGCIPVVADIPASREWIDDGVNGVIVNSLKDNFIADALELDSQKVAAINRGIINKRGLKSVNRDKFVNLYKQILND